MLDWTVCSTLKETSIKQTHLHHVLGAVPHVARLCCCDDQGHAGCVVGLATVSGEASGGDVMNREVKRHSRQEARREKDNITDCIHNTHSVCLYVCTVEQRIISLQVVDQFISILVNFLVKLDLFYDGDKQTEQ